MLVDDWLEGCSAFLDCNGNGFLDASIGFGDDLPEISGDAVSSESGLVTFTFDDPQDQATEEANCLYAFDAASQSSSCINIGTNGPAQTSQICAGAASDCTVMSTMCTLVGFSSTTQIDIAFGINTDLSSVPQMDFGLCTPCNCDPIAALQGILPQDPNQVVGRDFLEAAQNQLVGITTCTSYIALADSYLGQTIYPAHISPGRQSLTEAIESAQGPLDLTKASNILDMLERAQEIWEGLSADNTRRSLQEKDLPALAALVAGLNTWYDDEVSSTSDNIVELNLANQLAASRELMLQQMSIMSGTGEDISTINIEDITSEARQNLEDSGLLYTPPPTAAPGSDDDSGVAVIAGTAGGIGGAALLALLAYFMMKGKQDSAEEKAGKDFNSMVTIVDDGQSTAITPGGLEGAGSGGGMKLAEQQHDDLPSATI